MASHSVGSYVGCNIHFKINLIVEKSQLVAKLCLIRVRCVVCWEASCLIRVGMHCVGFDLSIVFGSTRLETNHEQTLRAYSESITLLSFPASFGHQS